MVSKTNVILATSLFSVSAITDCGGLWGQKLKVNSRGQVELIEQQRQKQQLSCGTGLVSEYI
jgi:hypothetical protein